MSEEKSSKNITAYTDGSCIPNPGNGGWGAIAVMEEYDLYLSGGKKNTTNNVMELTAVTELLKEFSDYKNFTIFTDSQYVINCATGKWKKTKNIKQWKRYSKYSKEKNINFIWVKGHSGDEYNEKVDQLAKRGGILVS